MVYLPIRNKDLLREKYYIFIIIDIFVNKCKKTLKKATTEFSWEIHGQKAISHIKI